MTQAKDELFCRLALRQGLLSKEDATALLKHYRSEAKAGEGVGAFAVRNEYMDRGTASTIEGAINRRADGHVADTRRRVPKRGKGAGGSAPATRATHRAARQTAPKANGTQVAMVAIGGVVFIGAMIAIGYQFTAGSAKKNRTSTDETASDLPSGTNDPVKKIQSKLLEEEKVIVLSAKEIEDYRSRMETAKNEATQESMDERYAAAIARLQDGIKEMGGDKAPASIRAFVQELQEREKEFIEVRDETYNALLADLEKASEEDKAFILDDIQVKCGVELRRKAESGGGDSSG